MSQNQHNKEKKLWKNIKTHKNNRQQNQSETAQRFSMPDARKKQSQVSKGRGFYSDAFATNDQQLQNLQNHYSSPYDQSSQPEVNQQAQQIDIQKALQANFQEEADQIFGKQEDINIDEIVKEDEFMKQLESNDKKRFNFLEYRNSQVDKQENRPEDDMQYLREMDEEPIMRSLSENYESMKHTKRMIREKLQRVGENVKNLNEEMRGIYIRIEESKYLWKSWVIEKMNNDITHFLQNYIKNQADQGVLQTINAQILEFEQTAKKRISILEKKITEKTAIINILETETNNQKQRIKHLEKQLEATQDQNIKLAEQIFDGDQRIAQIDLEVDQKVKEILAKEGLDFRGEENHHDFGDKQRYLKQIRQLQENLYTLSEKYKKNSQNQADLYKISQLEEEVNERQYALKMQEEEIQNHYIDIQNKKNELNMYCEQLKLREEELKNSESNLYNKLAQVEEKEKRLLRISQTTQVYKRPTEAEQDYQERHMENIDTKNYMIRGQMRQHPKFENNYRNPGIIKHSLHKEVQFEAISEKNNSKSRDTKTALKARTKYGTEQHQKLSIREKVGQSGVSGYTRSRATSSNTQNNNRLNDLGSKLQRLRQEIKKQINEAR